MNEPRPTIEWKRIDAFPPPREVVLWTKIDDGHGSRNESQLKLNKAGNLWFVPDGRMYVYYAPTHWRAM